MIRKVEIDMVAIPEEGMVQVFFDYGKYMLTIEKELDGKCHSDGIPILKCPHCGKRVGIECKDIVLKVKETPLETTYIVRIICPHCKKTIATLKDEA